MTGKEIQTHEDGAPNGSLGDAITEIAKAEQERQRTAQQLLTTAREVGAYLGPHFRSAVADVGAIAGNQIAYWKLLHLNGLLRKVRAKLDAGQLHSAALRPLSFGDALRVLEAASTEEEDQVQEMWARLICNAVKPDGCTSIKKVYVDLLKSMSSAEVILLDFLHTAETRLTPKLTMEQAQQIYPELSAAAEVGWRRLDETQQNVAIQNLIRLRCIIFRGRPINAEGILSPVGEGFFAERSHGVKQAKFEELIEHMVELIDVTSGRELPYIKQTIPLLTPLPHTPPPELVLALSPLGGALMEACRQH